MAPERPQRHRRPFRRACGAILPIALLLFAAAPAPAAAQTGVTVIPVAELRFGTIAAGIPTTISPADAARRASVDLIGTGEVTVTLQVPLALRSAHGATLPLRFGAGDARIVLPNAERVIDFDPRAPLTFSIPPAQSGAQLFLGGTALPSLQQRPGSYSGSITVQVVIATTTS